MVKVLICFHTANQFQVVISFNPRIGQIVGPSPVVTIVRAFSIRRNGMLWFRVIKIGRSKGVAPTTVIFTTKTGAESKIFDKVDFAKNVTEKTSSQALVVSSIFLDRHWRLWIAQAFRS